MIALTAAALFTPLDRIERPLLLMDDGRVVELGTRSAREVPSNVRLVDFGDAIIAPAFVDMHIHGGAGHDVMEADSKALPAIERFLAQHGVGSYFPTTVTAPLETILAALDRLANAIEAAQRGGASSDGFRARPMGIHLEGPFLSHAQRGVHPPEDLLPPSRGVFECLWQASRGHLRVMTIAPELEGALEVIAEASRRGVCVSLGHSNADLQAARAGMAAGARHATHTFNAMRQLHHRDPGILAEVLTDATITADIIADGVHVDPAIVKLFLLAKGAGSAVLITDATAASGMREGHYRLGSLEIEVKDGRCLANGKLAGSVLTMDHAVCNVMKFAGWSLQQAIRPATLNPARVTGLAPNQGVIAAGGEADLVILTPSGEVKHTLIRGRGI